jgi:prepilin peptidase CpaA
MNVATFLLLFALAAATWIDVKSHRIPNSLSFGLMVAGLLTQSYTSGAEGLLTGLGGLLTGLVIFLPFYFGGGMGAGDVKLMAAVGTFLGPGDTLWATGLTLIAGGVLGVGIMLIRGNAKAFLRRYGLMLQCLFATGQVSYVPPHAGEAAIRFPYALAIAVGTAATLWLSK